MNAGSVLTQPRQATPEPASQPAFQHAQAGPARLPLPCLIPVLASSLLLWLCFFPLAWCWLGWVALVPLLALVRSEARSRNIYFSAYLGGLAFFLAALEWMTVADYRMIYTWLMLAFYCALYFPVGILFLRRLDAATRWPLTVTVPLVWVALEFVRSFLLTGFAWYYLGHTQHQYLSLIQIADLGGAYTVSLLVAAVNGWVFECLYAFHGFRRFLRQAERPGPDHVLLRLPVVGGGILLVLIAATVVYGSWRLSQQDFHQGPVISLLQASIDQRLRNEAFAAPNRKAKDIEKHYLFMCQQALRQWPAPNLLVWPETSYPYTWLQAENLMDLPDDLRDDVVLVRKYIRGTVQGGKTAQLLGINTKIFTGGRKYKQYNTALLLNADGNEDGRYDKIHRVPFGEYVPFKDWLPFMNRFAPYDFDYGVLPGEKMTRLPLTLKHDGKERTYHFGVLICYEDTDPFLARQYGRDHEDGPPVDFLLNISNDGWFDGTREHDEHLAISRFRAIETRRALGRAVNMGISAIIDGNGRVLKPSEVSDSQGVKLWAVLQEKGEYPELPLAEWAMYKKSDGVLTAAIPIDNRFSLYAHTGDWLPGLCWATLFGAWGWRKWRTRFGRPVTRHNHESTKEGKHEKE